MSSLNIRKLEVHQGLKTLQTLLFLRSQCIRFKNESTIKSKWNSNHLKNDKDRDAIRNKIKKKMKTLNSITYIANIEQLFH